MERMSKDSRIPGDHRIVPDDQTSDHNDENAARSVVRKITRYYLPIFRKAGLTLHDAQEAAANVSYKFLTNQHKIRKSEKGFVNKLAANELRDFIRKNSSQKRRNISTVHDSAQLEQVAGKQVQQSRERLMFEDILQTLTPRQQEILKLLLAGFSQVEIAVEIDIKPSTVFYHIQQLKKNRLIKELYEQSAFKRKREGDERKL